MKISRQTNLCIFTTIVALGCGGDAGSGLAAYRTQLHQNAGVPTFSPVDGGIGYTKVIDGQSAIFVSNARMDDPIRTTFGIWDHEPYFSPDGQWIAFDRDIGIGEIGDVFMIPSGGGEEIPIAVSAAEERVQGWTPDGAAVLYRRNNQTWVGSVDGGEQAPLLDLEEDFFGVPSPDGSSVAYSLSSGGLTTVWLFDSATGQYHQLTEDGYEGNENPDQWSPDGSEFGYLTNSTGTSDIWLADALTRTVRQLTRHLANDFDWKWSPDGRWIVFLSDRGGQVDVWVIESDGDGAPLRVTDDTRVETNLGWSHDGSRLIFNHSDAEVAVGMVDLVNPEPRTVFTAKATDSDFRISPDGNTILFTSMRSGNQDLWSVPVAGGEPSRLTRSPMPDAGGRWSADGQTIVFHSRRAGSRDVYTMSPDGQNVVQLTDWPGSETVGEWSPDGSLIAFYSNNETTEEDIWILPATGGMPRRITTLDAEPGGLQWSPDGQALLFAKSSSPSNPLQTLNRVSVNGGPVQELFEGDFSGARWSPDGRELVLSIVRDGYTRIHIMPSTGGTPRRVTSGAQEWDLLPLWTSDGTEIVYQSQIIAGKGLWEIKAVNVADETVRVLAQDSSRNFNYASRPANRESVLFTSVAADSPVDEVRIGELLADLGN